MIEYDKKTAAELIKEMAAVRGISQKELAAKRGTSPQNLNMRLKRNAFYTDEFRAIAESMGFAIKIVDESGAVLPDEKKPSAARVRKMVGGKIIDTAKSDLLCRSDMALGVSLEMYKSDDGNYYVVNRYGNKTTTVVPINVADAKRIYAAYGMQDIAALFD